MLIELNRLKDGLKMSAHSELVNRFKRKYLTDSSIIPVDIMDKVASKADPTHMNNYEFLAQLHDAVLSWGEACFQEVLLGFNTCSWSSRMLGILVA